MTTTVHHNLAGRLRGHFRGTLLEPGDEGYPEARRVWNGAFDRHPAVTRRPPCDYWDLTTCMWVRCPDA